MSYRVLTTEFFDKQLKKLIKKYPSLKKEFIELLDSLSENPKQGTYLGLNSYKIRLAISSKGKGKSGGARVITHLIMTTSYIHLTGIYDKSERESVNNIEILEMIKKINTEDL